MESEGLAGRRVLIVEDEFLIALHLEQMVRAAGGVVIGPVAVAGRALTHIQAGEVDIALLDIDLGKRRGLAVAAALRAGGVPFVLIVPAAAVAVCAEPAVRGAPRLSKSGSVSELVQAVAQAMHAAAAQPAR